MFHTNSLARSFRSAPWIGTAAVFLLTAVLWSPPALAQPAAGSGLTARVIVKFKEDASLLRKQVQASKVGEDVFEARARSHADNLSTRLGLKLRAGRLLTERSQVLLARGMTSDQLVQRLSTQADVEYAVVDQRRKINSAPNDPLYAVGPAISGLTGGPVSGQWYLRAPNGTVRSSINAEAAWNITTGSPSVVVAVLDSGVRFDHVDLKRVSEGGNLLDGYDFITNNFIANDGVSGRDSDASDPGDGVTAADVASTDNDVGCESSEISNSSWHGTLVAGLISATSNNGVGMASVGRTVRVLPVRVLGRCGGFDSDIIAGMRWAAGLSVPGIPDNPGVNRARVLNMSLGGGGVCTAYNDAVSEINGRGVVVVASAGNSAGQAVSVPAKCAGVIGVTGLRHIGTKVGFSDLGPEISISAPGGNCVNIGANEPCLYPILSSSNSGRIAPVLGVAGSIYTDAFDSTVGTSFSAPLVAGTAALMLSVRPEITPAEVLSQLRATARPFPSTGSSAGIVQCNALSSNNGEECYCNTSTCGAGMLDTGAAVAAVNGLLLAVITSSPNAPIAGQTVSFSANSSSLAVGRIVQSYSWSISSSGGIVATPLPTGMASTFAVTPTGEGRFSVTLTVVDNSGASSTSSQTVTVAPAPAPAPAPVPVPVPVPTSSGGGGATTSLYWLLGIALAAWCLSRTHRV